MLQIRTQDMGLSGCSTEDLCRKHDSRICSTKIKKGRKNYALLLQLRVFIMQSSGRGFELILQFPNSE